MATAKTGYRFAVLIAIYGVYLDQKIRSRIDGKVWQLPAAVYGRMVNLEPDMTISKNEMVKLRGATPVSSGVENDPSWRIYRAGQQH